MSSYDDDTDLEIADALQELNIRLVRANLLHAGDDAIMIQAYKRLSKYDELVLGITHDKQVVIKNEGETMTNFGGMSSPFGITFFGENYKATLSTKYSIGWKGIKKLPQRITVNKTHIKNEQLIIFALFILLDIVINIRTYVIKGLLYIKSIIPESPVGHVQLPSGITSTITYIIDIVPWLYLILILEVIFIIGMIFSVRQTRKYHGSEHKVIMAVENNDLANASKYTRIHPRCGTNIMPLYFVYLIIFTSLFPTLMLGGTSIVFALFTIKKVPIASKFSITIGNKLQILTTREPTEKQLTRASDAMRMLVNAEITTVMPSTYYYED